MKKEVKIPDIAENVESGLVAGILVSEGDKVEKDQALVEIETDKAATDIPSPFKGTVSEIKIKEGEEVKVHQVIMIIDTPKEEEEEEEEEKDKTADEAGEKDQKKDDRKQEDKDSERTGKEKEEVNEKVKEEGEGEGKGKGKGKGEGEEAKEEVEKKEKDGEKKMSDIPASPSVRRMAREMNVDLTKVRGSGPGKRLTAEDIKEAGEKKQRLPDFSKYGDVSEEKMSNTRKKTAENVSNAWKTIPHVSQFDEADMTHLDKFMEEIKEKISKEGAKLTVTSVLLKITTLALRKFPRFNSSLDMESGNIIHKHYLNIGVAVDSPRGLLVPVIQDADKKSLEKISLELAELAQKVRDKKISLEELQGGTFTISNLGGIGGTAFTPIVYPPQVAILGVSRAAYKKIYIKGKYKKRLVLPLSLSYDHRVIDGADGARFLRWICDVIENPYTVIL